MSLAAVSSTVKEFFSEMLEKLNHFYFDVHLNAYVQ